MDDARDELHAYRVATYATTHGLRDRQDAVVDFE